MGGAKTAGVGFGMGLERLMLTLEAEGISLGDAKVPDVFFVSIGENAKLHSFALAQKTREEGLIAQSDLMNRSLKNQMKYADKIGAKYTIVLGDDEISNMRATAKNMQTKEEIEIDLSQSISKQIYKEV